MSPSLKEFDDISAVNQLPMDGMPGAPAWRSLNLGFPLAVGEVS